MPRTAQRLVALLALALVAWLAFSWWNTDRRRILRRVGELQELLAKGPGESRLEGLQRTRAVTELFADRFEALAPAYDVAVRDDRRALAAAVHRYRAGADRVDAEILDRELTVDGAAGRALLYVTVELVSGFRGVRGREAYRFRLDWVQEEGEWRIDRAELLEVIEEPPGGLF